MFTTEKRDQVWLATSRLEQRAGELRDWLSESPDTTSRRGMQDITFWYDELQRAYKEWDESSDSITSAPCCEDGVCPV